MQTKELPKKPEILPWYSGLERKREYVIWEVAYHCIIKNYTVMQLLLFFFFLPCSLLRKRLAILHSIEGIHRHLVTPRCAWVGTEHVPGEKNVHTTLATLFQRTWGQETSLTALVALGSQPEEVSQRGYKFVWRVFSGTALAMPVRRGGSTGMCVLWPLHWQFPAHILGALGEDPLHIPQWKKFPVFGGCHEVNPMV